MLYLGIDIGTSAIKIVLTKANQQVLAQLSQPLTVSRPQPLWSEQAPEDWWQVVDQIIQTLAKEHDLSAVQAIGVAGQMHGAVCLGRDDQVLRPAILWNDGRSHQQCDILNAHPADFKRINGNTVMPGFTAPKLLWLQQHEPAVFADIHKVLLPKDYINWQLSGEYATDVSDAAGTAWLDVGQRCWSAELLAATGLTLQQMPKVHEGIEVIGQLRPHLAQRWGMSKAVNIVAGAGDNAAGAVSLGIINDDRAMLSLGTSGVYFVPNPDFRPDTSKGFHSFCHCMPNTWHQMGVILSAASCIKWWLNVTKMTDENALLLEAEQADAKHVPIFLPYLSGERTPHNDALAKGNFFAMTHATGRAEFTQAVLEGVAFAIADCQHVLQQAGTEVNQVSLIGGGAKSTYWGQILANVLNKPMSYHNESRLGPAFGAARLAMINGQPARVQDVVQLVNVTNTIQPDRQQHLQYQQRLSIYRQLYQQLKPLWRKSNA